MPKVSVVVPSKKFKLLNYLLHSLKVQIMRPSEVIIVVKGCETGILEDMCRNYGMSCVIIEQKKGFFTTALNIGKKEASGDIVLFTDDDAIAPSWWVKKYVKAFSKATSDVACISSRDVYVTLNGFKTVPTKDDFPQTKLYRWLVRTWLEPPLDVLREYRFGVYLSKRLDVVHGPYLPKKTCLSLPYRGVNMGFKKEAIEDAIFPEHPCLKRAPGNEQYVGLQLVIKGWRLIYTPNNPIHHINLKESLSRVSAKKESELKYERSIMKTLTKALLKAHLS